MDPKKEEVRREHIRLHMEGTLTARDKVGVQDFVLLDAHTSESAFVDNLRKRFNENLIYTYIGTLLVSVNPYQELGIYTVSQMELYQGVSFFELPPHVYAIADNAYRMMCSELNNHFILISGESGAGKTEASKKILQYFAVTCPMTESLQIARDRLLLSNPVLEAFGNAKTLRNDNSSRFGKYMDIQFDFQGIPVGGHIISYLIEKSRVVYQNQGERNFHIFYQLLAGGEAERLAHLGLERDPRLYKYLSQGHRAKESSLNDKNNWKTVSNAFSVIDFTKADLENLFGIIASVLHLGNICFEEDPQGCATVPDTHEIKWIAKLLGVCPSVLLDALTHRKIEAKTEEVICPLTPGHSVYARDAMAKAVYGRTFTWLVNKINSSLVNKDVTKKTVIGLLDIYGFEVFDKNGFEQFCINYCNEKLQQLLIERTLKAEQAEYEMEGIEWEPIQYFNNKIICDLVEERHKGIISILDEECIRPGPATDLSFLEKLEEKVGEHAHFQTRKLAGPKGRKRIGWMEFQLLHYAGEVTYCTKGFLEKNNDLLYRHLKEVLCRSSNRILRECFLVAELENRRRPPTVGTQFKNSLGSLLEMLLCKEPSYIRCIKPNDTKEPSKFDDFLIRHQIKYLGLMEHLRVRRAGFAYRRRYEHFLQRYKSLCPDTWPHWHGPPGEGVERLIKYIGYRPEEYKLGKTKIFIRFPRTLFATEDAFEFSKHQLVARIQATYKGRLGRREYVKKRQAATKLEAHWRGVLARREVQRRRWAVQIIRRPLCPDNEEFIVFVRKNYILNLRNHVPKNVLDKSWLRPPGILEHASDLLRKMCMRNLVRKYCHGVTDERRAMMQQKVVTSEIFRGKKEGYADSLRQPFATSRIDEGDIHPKVLQLISSEKVEYGVPVIKYDRKGFKARQRQLILTRKAAYVVEMAKIKQKIEYSALKGVSTSSLSDGILVIHVSPEDNKQKGDAVLQCEHTFEAVTKLVMLVKKENMVNVVQGSLQFYITPGKEGTIVFHTGPEEHIYKDKNGQLTVVSGCLGGGGREAFQKRIQV
ncbi:unconventional myosin-Ih isoform X2 [Marmota marmota marmota]|uniref:unconventional myosin-Ih isoform X2 n=1 Tax=Marmota marmota marmota TaxID=9994 RepID=UPI0020923E6F|nr:unconventional myosin-Ih isoform X2 [Marmota marmota marmota]